MSEKYGLISLSETFLNEMPKEMQDDMRCISFHLHNIVQKYTKKDNIFKVVKDAPKPENIVSKWKIASVGQ